MANPYFVKVGTFNGGLGVAQSGFATFSFVMTSDFECLVPISINNPGTTSISAGGTVFLYRSVDNGGTWETEPFIGGGFRKPTAANQVQRLDVPLVTGWYLVSVNVGGGVASTWTVQMGTAEVLTAYA